MSGAVRHEGLVAGGSLEGRAQVDVRQLLQGVSGGQVVGQAGGRGHVDLQGEQRAGRGCGATDLVVRDALGCPEELADLCVGQRVGRQVADGAAPGERRLQGHAAVGARRGKGSGGACGVHAGSLPAMAVPSVGPSVASVAGGPADSAGDVAPMHAPGAEQDPADGDDEAGGRADEVPGADHGLPEVGGQCQLLHPGREAAAPAPAG